MFKINTVLVKSNISTIFNEISYYTTLKGVKEGDELTVREYDGTVLQKCSWVNGVKKGYEYEYQNGNNHRRVTFYEDGKKHGNEIYYFDNDSIQAIDTWDMGTLVKRLLYRYIQKSQGEMILHEKIDYITHTGIEYYEDGHTVKRQWNFKDNSFEGYKCKYYNKDGTRMSVEQEYETLGYTRCHICNEFECDH